MSRDNHPLERALAGEGSLSAKEIASLASPRIVSRGLSYCRDGRVSEVALRHGQLEALVAGTGEEPYLVRVSWDGEEPSCRCSCPFDWEVFCKHGIATLFAWSGTATAAEEVLDAEFEQLREDMLAEREERGRKQKFKVTHQAGDRYYGTFEVESLSGKTYQVEIRSLSEKLNRCTCLDYVTSMLGTCKHIEAVLARIRQRAPKKSEWLAAKPPKKARIMLSREDAPAVVVRLPPRPPKPVRELCGEFFDLSGRLKVDAGEGFQELLARSRDLKELRVDSDAIEFSAGVLRERRFAARSAEVSREILAGGGRIPGLKADLYPFQVDGTAFLASAGRGVLADDMGLGKTVQAIAAMTYLRERGEVDRTLIVCPASLKHQWRSEIARFSGIDATVLEGGPAARIKLYRSRPPVLIANYELIRRDLEKIEGYGPDLLVLDEAQRIKNWRTITAESVKQISTPFAFVLTGTPLQNRLEDLYSLMQVVDRRVLGPLWQFEDHFIERTGRGKALGYRRMGELRRRLRPVLKRREKKEVLTQLPERLDSIFDVTLTKGQRNIMEEAEQGAAQIVARAAERPLRPEELDRLMRLMQTARMACNAAGLVDKVTKGSPKLEEFSDLLREVCVEGRHKVVVFSEWKQFQKMAVAEAKRLKLDHVVLHGSIPSSKRGKLIERFMQDPDCLIFFSTDAGGVGLNLQAADTVINLDLPWNPAILEQRIGRVHRQGQLNAVNVLLLIAQNSFEQRIWEILKGKRAIFDAALSPDTDVDWVETPSGCLKVAQELYGEDVAAPEGFTAAEEEEWTAVGGGAPAAAAEDRAPAAEAEGEAAPAVAESQAAGVPESQAPSAAPESEAGLPESQAPSAEQTGYTGQPSPDDVDVDVGQGIAGRSSTSTGKGSALDLARACADVLGHRVERVMRLQTGQVVAVVDRVDEVTRDVTTSLGLIALSRDVAEGMAALGEAAPTARAEVLLDRRVDGAAQAAERRRQMLSVSKRKLSAARSLRSGGMGPEALEQASSAMHQAIRSLAPANGEVVEMVPARLLYEVLVPQGKLTLEQAGLIQRAEALARAYGTSTAPVPEGLLSQVIRDAEGLLERIGTV